MRGLCRSFDLNGLHTPCSSARRAALSDALVELNAEHTTRQKHAGAARVIAYRRPDRNPLPVKRQPSPLDLSRYLPALLIMCGMR